MLSTRGLEKYIRKEVLCRIEELHWENIFFQKVEKGVPEGVYIFSSNGEYHISFTEKGKIKEDLVTVDKEEALWQVVKVLSFNISLKYAGENKENGKDFRRMLFKKEMEIFSAFGEKFLERRKTEIEKILKANPYKDVIYDFVES